MRSLAQRLKRSKYKKAKPFEPIPPLLKFLIVVLMVGVVSFSGLYGYWQNQYYGRGGYHFPGDPFTNVWNGQVGNYTLSGNATYAQHVDATVGFGTSIPSSSTSGGPLTGTDTGHLSFNSAVAAGNGILVYVYTQSPQSYYENDTTQNAGVTSVIPWSGNSTTGNNGRVGVCYVATESGVPAGVSFFVKNNQTATGTIQAEIYSTTGSQSLAGVSAGSGCAGRSTLIATSTNSVSMSALSSSVPSFAVFNFNSSSVVKGREYVIVAHMTFTNSASKSLWFEIQNGTWFNVSPQGPYCQATWNGGFVSPSYANCNYSNVSNAATVATFSTIATLSTDTAVSFGGITNLNEGLAVCVASSATIALSTLTVNLDRIGGTILGARAHAFVNAVASGTPAGNNCTYGALVGSSASADISGIGTSSTPFTWTFTGGSVVSGVNYIVGFSLDTTIGGGRAVEVYGNLGTSASQSSLCKIASVTSGCANGSQWNNFALCNFSDNCMGYLLKGVSGVTSSNHGPLSDVNNDLNQYGCDGNVARKCVWFNVAIDPVNSVALCADLSCFSVTDERGNAYSGVACVSTVDIAECLYAAVNGANTVAWVDVASSSSRYYSVLSAAYSNFVRFGPTVTNSTSCSGVCSSLNLVSPPVFATPNQKLVSGYQVYFPDPNGFETTNLASFQTVRLSDGNDAAFGSGQCDGYTPCGSNLVTDVSNSQLYCYTSALCTPGRVNTSFNCSSGVGSCVDGAEAVGIWTTLLDNRCPNGWECFLSGLKQVTVGGNVTTSMKLYANHFSGAVALSNDSYSLATAVGKPLAFDEQIDSDVYLNPWAWYLTTNGTLPVEPNYNPLNDPNVYLAMVGVPVPALSPLQWSTNGTIDYYVYMKHSEDREGLLAAAHGAFDTYPDCSPNANEFLCARQKSGIVGGVNSLLLNFTGSTEGGAGAPNNCAPNFTTNNQPCGASFMCFSSAATTTGTCNIGSHFSTGQTVSLVNPSGQVNWTRTFPWLDIQSQKFHTGFWAEHGIGNPSCVIGPCSSQPEVVVHKWFSGEKLCSSSSRCDFDVFSVVFPSSGSCVLIAGSVPCNTQETGFIGWLGGLFGTVTNFVGEQFPVLKPFLNLGDSLLGAFASGISQAFLLMASQLKALLNQISVLWGDGHLGDDVFTLLQGTINTLNQILGGFGTFALWIFNFVFIVVPFLVGNFVTLIVSVSASVYVIVLTLFPLIVAFGGIINMPLQSLFFFDYVFGLSEVLFFGLPGFVSWIRFNIWLFTLGWKVFDYFTSKTIWTIRSLKQLLPVVG